MKKQNPWPKNSPQKSASSNNGSIPRQNPWPNQSQKLSASSNEPNIYSRNSSQRSSTSHNEPIPNQVPWSKNQSQRPSTSSYESTQNQNVYSKNRSQRSTRRNTLDQQNQLTNKPLFLKLNRKVIKIIFSKLSTIDLARLSRTCRRFRNTIESLVDELTLYVDWHDDDYQSNHTKTFDYKHVTLSTCPPADFFYPYPAFKSIKSLFLCFDDLQGDKINLTKYLQLKHLKIRGGNIQLSSNRLPSVTHIDIDDPNNMDKQVFRNLKKFHLEADLETLSDIHNVTELVLIKYIFTKSLDCLLDKRSLKRVEFTIQMVNMELIVFEEMIGSLDTFLKNLGEENNQCTVGLRFKHSTNYQLKGARWQNAWKYLEETLPKELQNFFDLTVEELGDEHNIPVV